MTDEPLLFALGASQAFGAQVAAELGLALAPHEDRRYENGELKQRPLVSVHGRHVYVLHSLYGEPASSVHDKLCELLFFIATVRDAGAAYITSLQPYLCYGRKDRRGKPRDPVTTRYVAQLLEAAGVDCVLALEVHNRQAFDNAFRCRTEHLQARASLLEALLPELGQRPLSVVAPDAGGVKRAELFRQALAARCPQPPTSAFVEKHRDEQTIRGGALAGEVDGRVAVIVDDLISTGTTLLRAMETCRQHGAVAVFAVATHAVFAPGIDALLTAPGLDGLLVTNSITVQQSQAGFAKLRIVPVESVFARAISALHANSDTPVLTP